MARKPRIPAPESILRCEICGKPTNGKGYYGPECHCGRASETKLGHRIG